MKKLERGIMNVTGCFLAALMFLMMVDIFAAVLVRYVFHTALNFSEELGRYVFVWIVFIGMARCIAADKHVALDLLPGFLKGKSGRNLYAVIYIFSALFFSAVTYAGIKLCEVGEKQKSATMRIPMNYIYLCIPICGTARRFCFRSQFTGGNRTRRLSDYGSGPENVYRSRFFPADGDSIVYACGSFNEPRRYHEAYH